jgi:hypothetical protein
LRADHPARTADDGLLVAFNDHYGSGFVRHWFLLAFPQLLADGQASVRIVRKVCEHAPWRILWNAAILRVRLSESP